MTFRHRWVLRVGQEANVSEGARLLGIMAMTEFGKPHEGAEFWPSQQAMADLIGVSERTARRRMDELVDARLVEKRPGGFGGSNRYVALIPNEDSGVLIESTANPDRGVLIGEPAAGPQSGQGCPPNPDRADLSMRTGVSYEQTQQHSHPTGPPPVSPFRKVLVERDGGERSDDESTPAHSVWDEARDDPSPAVTEADLIASGELTILPPPIEPTRQERKSLDGHRRMLRDEGLDEYGEGPASKSASGYRSRSA